MKVIIKETNETKTLNLIDEASGQNWVEDFIGNQGAFADGQFTWDAEEGAYYASQEDYDWWAEAVEEEAAK